MKLAWTWEALADRRAIFTYIEARNLQAAVALDNLIAENTDLLVAHPESGRPGRVEGTRELVTHPNYVVIYDLGDDTVRILRVLHTAQQWPPPQAE